MYAHILSNAHDDFEEKDDVGAATKRSWLSSITLARSIYMTFILIYPIKSLLAYFEDSSPASILDIILSVSGIGVFVLQEWEKIEAHEEESKHSWFFGRHLHGLVKKIRSWRLREPDRHHVADDIEAQISLTIESEASHNLCLVDCRNESATDDATDNGEETTPDYDKENEDPESRFEREDKCEENHNAKAIAGISRMAQLKDITYQSLSKRNIPGKGHTQQSTDMDDIFAFQGVYKDLHDPLPPQMEAQTFSEDWDLFIVPDAQADHKSLGSEQNGPRLPVLRSFDDLTRPNEDSWSDRLTAFCTALDSSQVERCRFLPFGECR